MADQPIDKTSEVIRDLTQSAMAIQTQAVSGSPHVLLIKKTNPGGATEIETRDLERFFESPRRIREKVDLVDAQSLIEYLKRFGQINTAESPGDPSVIVTAIFFDDVKNVMMAVLDYSGPDASWGEHVATCAAQI